MAKANTTFRDMAYSLPGGAKKPRLPQRDVAPKAIAPHGEKVRARPDIYIPEWTRNVSDWGRTDSHISKEVGVCQDLITYWRLQLHIPVVQPRRKVDFSDVDWDLNPGVIANQKGCTLATVLNYKKRKLSAMRG